MELFPRTALIVCLLYITVRSCESAKINTPRVLLPWFENLNVNFTFEIIEGGCYTWSLSRDDIIDLEPLYEDTWGHCSQAARVSVSKSCSPPGTVIILAEEVNSGEILRGDVDIDTIKYLKVMSTTWKLYLEEAPEAFEVIAYDDQGNTFSTLEGVSFTWTVENLGNNVGEDDLVTLVRWRDTDYEAPRGVSHLEAQGLRAQSVLLYGQAMGECKVTVCLDKTNICTDFNLNVVASVVLTPATATIAPQDTIRYKVVRARAGRLTIQDISETLYYVKVPDTSIASLEDTISLVRGTKLGTTSVILMSGSTEVATATLNVAEPYAIRITLRPTTLLIRGEPFIAHCVVLDESGHALTAGDEMLIRLTTDGEANVDLIRSTENGTLTDAVANNAGAFTIYAKLYSIAGKTLSRKVEGQISAVAVDPLEVVPPELFVAWTDSILDVTLQHRGGGAEEVMWSEKDATSSTFSLTPTGVLSIRGVGEMDVKVHLKKYPHVKAFGKVWSQPAEYIQVSSSGHARVGRPHHLHVALTATHPVTGELYNFHSCNCGSFAVSLLEGPEPHNVTAATWIEPIDGACCVLQVSWSMRGACTLRVSRGRTGDTARVQVRAPPRVLWPQNAAALVGATLPVLAEGEALVAHSSEPRVAELALREGPPPHRYPDITLFTMKCRRKGDARLALISETEDEQESAEIEAACAPHVSRIRLEPSETPGNCSGGPKVWLRPGQEVSVKVSLYDAVGRELLDERGPKVSWETEPHHNGIAYRWTDRLLVDTHPDYAPVPVPYKYYQSVSAEEKAVGWSGALTAKIPDAAATIQAKVVAPLKVDPLRVNLAWEGETVSNIAVVSGGSGRYAVEGAAGVSGAVVGGALSASMPGPGAYDLVVADLCVREKLVVEVTIEEVLSVEVSTARAVCVGACVPVQALVRGVSHRYLTGSKAPEWRVAGNVQIKDGQVCGLEEGSGRIRAALGGVWSPEVEILVFPPLQIIPSSARLPPAARLQLRHAGGPPSHLANTGYKAVSGVHHVEVSPSGSLHGLSLGTARIKLTATDINGVEMASAESEVEVVPISGLRVRAATQILLVGRPAPLWLEAAGLTAASLNALQPAPRVTFSARDPSHARLYTGHADDMLERSVAEGLSVRVVPLKPGVITIDVRVRNMGQVAETRSWDSTIEILAISDIRTGIEGLPTEFSAGDRLALAPGQVVRLRSMPRSSWQAITDGAFELTANGEVKALVPGHGVLVAMHKDDRNNVYREATIHVEVSLPHYCTAEPAGDDDETAVRVVLRNSVGRELLAPDANVSVLQPLAAHVRRAAHRELLAPDANVSVLQPLAAHVRRAAHSALGNELLITDLDTAGTFMTFESSAGGVALTDEVWVAGHDPRADRIIATGGWAVCLEGVGWRAPAGVSLHAGSGVTLAVLMKDAPAKHILRLDRAANTYTIHQIPVNKMEFVPGEWPAALVPLTIEASGLTSGPLLCAEDQKYALEGVEAVLPFTCRTKAPHTAQPTLDIASGQLGCQVIPAAPHTEASEVELCAEWEVYRTCTKVLLLPPIQVSHRTLSLVEPNPIFTITGHPLALKGVKTSVSPGLKIEKHVKDGEINVLVKSETTVCGLGWVNVKSKLTAQSVRVEIDRKCDVTCGTLLGAIFSLVKPYLSVLVTIAAIAAGILFVQAKTQQLRSNSNLRNDPSQSVLPAEATPPPPLRSRTWARSPYAAGPVTPVYGDASALPDNSFSPNSTRMHSRFL